MMAEQPPDRRRDRDELLLEAATTAYRDRDTHGRIQLSPAWADLTTSRRDELFERQLTARRLEQAIDEQGLSSTARSVLSRAEHLDQLP